MAKQPWQTIESAPHDATEILVTDGVRLAVVHWWQSPNKISEPGDTWWWYASLDPPESVYEWTPTHWLPRSAINWRPVGAASPGYDTPALFARGDDGPWQVGRLIRDTTEWKEDYFRMWVPRSPDWVTGDVTFSMDWTPTLWAPLPDVSSLTGTPR